MKEDPVIIALQKNNRLFWLWLAFMAALLLAGMAYVRQELQARLHPRQSRYWRIGA